MTDFYDYLPYYLQYWLSVDIHFFIRVFWFFLFLEVTRYFIFDFLVVFGVKIHLRWKKKRLEKARQQLRLENPFISIIAPGKNEGKHLFALVNTLAEQTYQNFELIIVDDGSDDDSAIIGRNLEQRGFIHKFISTDVRGGKASAANLALRFCKGKYVVHLDADCSLDRDAIESSLIPFYLNKNIGAVGGNLKVRNDTESLCTRLQAIEYLKIISLGRLVTSTLGIYRIVSGAFGSFRRDILLEVGGWDIGPGLDGDITVKIRKAGFQIAFAQKAVGLTSVPNTFKKLIKQRLRWNRSIIRFRVRKHADVYFPTANFSFLNFFSFAENIFYNVILDIVWWIYLIDMWYNMGYYLGLIIPMVLTMSIILGFIQMMLIASMSERHRSEYKLWWFVPLMPLYTGVFLRIVRTISYIQEFFFRKSYKDTWNPAKSSKVAEANGF